MTDRVTFEVNGLASRLRAAVSDSEVPDSGAIAAELHAQLTGDELDRAIQTGLKLLVERTARSMKAEAMRRAREDAAVAERPVREARRRQSARKRLTDLQRDHERMLEERFFSLWKETPTGRKFLGECTSRDLRYSGERHRERSETANRLAAEDGALAEAMEAANALTVRSFGYDRAVQALVVS